MLSCPEGMRWTAGWTCLSAFFFVGEFLSVGLFVLHLA
jgi:hypothetical protein